MPDSEKLIILTFVLAVFIAVMPLVAGGEPDKAEPSVGGALMAGTKTMGEPYVDHFWPTLSDYTADTGKSITDFAEAPMLSAMVDDGELPSLEDRFSDNPAVVRPVFEIGQYSAQLLSYGNAIEASPGNVIEGSQQHLGTNTPDFGGTFPSAVAGWSFSNNNRTFTLNLRPGMKWSDGEAFDADDFVFWYDAVAVDDRVFSRSRSRSFMWQGELPTMKKVSTYSVSYTYDVPYPSAPLRLLWSRIFYPEHYLAKYHIKYNSNAESLAKEAGFESWPQLFRNRSAERDASGTRGVTLSTDDIGMPVIDPWMIVNETPDSELWRRNPYYWKIDTAGNQLPYVDEVLVPFFTKPPEQVPLKAMAGELDIAFQLALADLPVLKRNESSGNYKIAIYKNGSSATSLMWAFNYTNKDPVLKKIFRDLRFRQAVSLAVDRQGMSDTLFFGEAEPVVHPAPTHWVGFEPWMNEDFSELDLDRANKLLDEMGLKWNSDKKWRLRPDGKVLTFEGSWPASWLPYFEDAMDLMAQYWEKIGVKMVPKFVPEELGYERAHANDVDVVFWDGAGGAEIVARMNYPIKLIPGWHWIHCCTATTAPWAEWYHSGRTEGEKPDIPDIIRQYEIVDEMRLVEYGTKEYEKLSNELLTLNGKNLWHTSTVAAQPQIMAISNRLGNLPLEGFTVRGILEPYMVDTFYIK